METLGGPCIPDLQPAHRRYARPSHCLVCMAARVLLVDHHDIVRLGVRTLLSNDAHWAVCSEAD